MVTFEEYLLSRIATLKKFCHEPEPYGNLSSVRDEYMEGRYKEAQEIYEKYKSSIVPSWHGSQKDSDENVTWDHNLKHHQINQDLYDLKVLVNQKFGEKEFAEALAEIKKKKGIFR